MKTIKVFAFIFSVALLAACAGGESETFAKVRSIQQEQIKTLDGLTATVEEKLAAIKGKIEAYANVDTTQIDTTAGAKAIDMAGANEVYTNLTNLSSELETLKGDITSKIIPSAEEMAKGTSNPFDGVNDQDLLTTFQGYGSRLNELKAKIDEQ